MCLQTERFITNTWTKMYTKYFFEESLEGLEFMAPIKSHFSIKAQQLPPSMGASSS
jgi:hypothetical protein